MTTRCAGIRRTGLAAVLCGSAVALVLMTGCKDQTTTPSGDRATDAQTIRDMEAKWSAAAAAKDLEGTLGYYADDATVLPPNMALMSDKASIRSGWTAMMAPTNTISWTSTKVEVAASGDLAWGMGTWVATMTDATGKVANDHGKYLDVWRKQQDGKWKVVADTWNSDVAAVTGPPVGAPASGTVHVTAPAKTAPTTAPPSN